MSLPITELLAVIIGQYDWCANTLALIQENGVTDNERATILNALFSRANTGLLKGDSGPAMSGDIVSLMAKYNNPSGK